MGYYHSFVTKVCLSRELSRSNEQAALALAGSCCSLASMAKLPGTHVEGHLVMPSSPSVAKGTILIFIWSLSLIRSLRHSQGWTCGLVLVILWVMSSYRHQVLGTAPGLLIGLVLQVLQLGALVVGLLLLEIEGPRVDGELGPGVNGIVLAAFTAWVSTSVSSSTYF